VGEKAAIRKRVGATRDAIPPAERRRKSQAIGRRLRRLVAYRDARTVFAYFSVRSEVETQRMIRAAWKAGKRVALPVTLKRGGRLVFRQVSDFEADLRLGLLAIPEPKASCPRVPAREADVIIVPGTAFDRLGHRLGTGGGFYDRFLCEVAEPPRIALAFEAQLVDRVPHADHDERVDFVVTERRAIRCRREATLTVQPGAGRKGRPERRLDS
jgi:5-formyltetrahydrofolate cyclo-ligase